MRKALRLRSLRLRVSPPVVVERFPSKVLVQHPRGQDSSHRDFAPTVEDRTRSLFPESLPLVALTELSMSMRTFVGRVVRHHRAQHPAPAPAGTVRPASA